MNNQAFEWATQRWKRRPLSKTKLIPADLFETEKSFLIKLPPNIYEPYIAHIRTIDQYGYVSFGSNYYWAHEILRGNVGVLEYSNKIRLCLERLSKGKYKDIEYKLPPWKTRNEKYFPDGYSKPKYEPRNIKKKSDDERTYLLKLSPICRDYLQFIFSTQCSIKQKHKFVRNLYYLSKKMTLPLFEKSLSRALDFHVADISAIVNIARQILQINHYDEPIISHIADYQERKSYLDGQFCEEEYNQERFKNLMNEDELEDKEEDNDV